MKDKLDNAEIITEVGPQKSEFAIFVDDVSVFSRLEQRRFPEADEVVAICQKI